tara:strand:- start:744 stop:1121 length:378 start_codon:yes stop_codon:yes gene_type:complete
MNLPQPSAWRYTHRDYAEKFVGYAYDTTKPKNCNHPNYVPMFTAGQMNQYGQACFEEGREARAIVEPMTEVADRFAHRMALELECALADRNVNWNRAMNLIGEYRSAMNAIHEQHSPTFMGEPKI